ncbi:nitroreductase family deazaflavin-dependent oxidoreductase [Ornithinimicrobium cavernae]|uniref:nitroreductase family deazaflavin-dependent oxidoreductase n=1 Tax=Ornithinimicrobium cavernae TaxID=2666047 RepID=UPI000D69338E|nr:nitroreductase family deazaflavin-dependent oxidoreductase [Ornithinimicrobium cavernae]
MTDTDIDRQDYIPPAEGWVRKQLDAIDEAGGDTSVAQIQGRPVVVVTMIGAQSGRPRRVPLMRVEHDGCYLAVASKGGAPRHPQWVANIRTHPDQVSVLDGTTETPMTSRELSGEERELWWDRGVEAFPPYADYQKKTDRIIPIFLLEPR